MRLLGTAAKALPSAVVLAVVASACTTTPDPTRELGERRTVARLIERHVSVGDHAGALACLGPGQTADCEEWQRFRAGLLEAAAEAPGDRYVMGQVVHSLVRSQAHDDALAVLESCRTDSWWCDVLRGYALTESGRIEEAETAFDRALRLMPEAELCDWSDIHLLTSGEVRSAYGGPSCTERLERLEGFWWLVDPSWLVPGNDRRAEHYNRVVWAALHDDALTGGSGDGRLLDDTGHGRNHHATVIRYGMDLVEEDGRWRGSDVEVDGYQVVPDEGALLRPFHASAAEWPVERNGPRERYVPRWGGLADLDAQVAFFERGDSLLAVAAAGLPEQLDLRTQFHGSALFLSTGPGSTEVAAHGTPWDGRWLFQATAPRRRYVVGLELAAAGWLGRTRFGHGLPHEAGHPLRLSDLLLYNPYGEAPPDSLEAALPFMRGGHRWRRGETIGVYLEVYAAIDPRSVPISVELEREGGWLARARESLGLGEDETVVTTWSQEGAGGRFSVAFTVGLGDLPEGDYTLRVTVEGPGMSPAVVEKELRIEG